MDLKNVFPRQKDFSSRNIWYPKRWYLFYNKDIAKLHQIGAVLEMPEAFGFVPWRHHIEIITKCKNVEEAFFYIRKTVESNWNRSSLINAINSKLYEKRGKGNIERILESVSLSQINLLSLKCSAGFG